MKALKKLANKENKNMYLGLLSMGSRCVFTTTDEIPDIEEIDWNNFPKRIGDYDDCPEVENLKDFEVHALCELGYLSCCGTKENPDDGLSSFFGNKIGIVSFIVDIFNGEKIYQSDIEEYEPDFKIELAKEIF